MKNASTSTKPMKELTCLVICLVVKQVLPPTQGVQPIKMNMSEDRVDDYLVTACLQGLDRETVIVQAKYWLGGDGTHSWMHLQIGIDTAMNP
jgi:hypothetical protein